MGELRRRPVTKGWRCDVCKDTMDPKFRPSHERLCAALQEYLEAEVAAFEVEFRADHP